MTDPVSGMSERERVSDEALVRYAERGAAFPDDVLAQPGIRALVLDLLDARTELTSLRAVVEAARELLAYHDTGESLHDSLPGEHTVVVRLRAALNEAEPHE